MLRIVVTSTSGAASSTREPLINTVDKRLGYTPTA